MFGQELFNVFIVELVMFMALGVIFFLVSMVLIAVSWLWKIFIILAILTGIKVAHVRTKNKLELIGSTPVLLHD
jgi:hypothetical protein